MLFLKIEAHADDKELILEVTKRLADEYHINTLQGFHPTEEYFSPIVGLLNGDTMQKVDFDGDVSVENILEFINKKGFEAL